MATAASSAQQASAQEANTAQELSNPFSAARNASGDAIASWRSAMQLPAELMVDNLQFLSHRLLANAAFIEELASCKDVSQVTARHSAFVSSTVEDYRRQSEVFARKISSHQPTARQKR